MAREHRGEDDHASGVALGAAAVSSGPLDGTCDDYCKRHDVPFPFLLRTIAGVDRNAVL